MIYGGLDWRLSGGGNGARGGFPEVLVKGFALLAFNNAGGIIGGLAGGNMLPGNVVPKYL